MKKFDVYEYKSNGYGDVLFSNGVMAWALCLIDIEII